MATKEEPIVHETPISDEEKSLELDIEEDEEERQCNLHEEGNQAYQSPMKVWFQSITRSVQCFLPYFYASHLVQLISHTSIHFKFHFSNYA